MKVSRLKQALQALQEKHDEARECLQHYDDSKEIQQFLNVLEAAEQGDKKGLFIKNQVSCFNGKKPTYRETVVRECVLWKACSNKGYAHVRS